MESLFVYQPFCLLRQRGVDGNNVRPGQQFCQAGAFILRLVIFSGRGVIDNLAAEHGSNLCNSLPDSAKSDNSPGHAVNFMKDIGKVRKGRTACIAAAFDETVIIRQLFQ